MRRGVESIHRECTPHRGVAASYQIHIFRLNHPHPLPHHVILPRGGSLCRHQVSEAQDW